MNETKTIYDFKVLDNQSNEVDLSIYKGKVLLVVNTATGCGFTKQYSGLEALYQKYHNQGFEILDFPCNQFFGQAPGSDEEIHEFCTLKYKTTFPRFKKIEVNGKKAEPLFSFLKRNEEGKEVKIAWNFTKFLVDQNGVVVHRFEPKETPESFEDKIAQVLSK